LSWHAQLNNKHLSEAGSYGYLIKAPIPAAALQAVKEISIQLEVNDALPGGLAIYGEQFGRYPLDPTLVFVLKK
jgi:predicted transcriptional regulator